MSSFFPVNVKLFSVSALTPSTTTGDSWREMKSRVSVSLCLLLASLAPPSALTRPKPYQGVRVRDPVKELLRRKRSLELHSAKTAPPTVVRTPWYATLTCMLDNITYCFAVTYIKMILRNTFTFWHSFYTTEQGFPQVWLSTLSKENHTLQTQLLHSSPLRLHPSIISH